MSCSRHCFNSSSVLSSPADGEHTHLLCFHIKPDAKPIPGNDLPGISGPNYLFQFFLKLTGVKIALDGLCCVKWMDIGVIRFKVKQPGPVDTDSAAEAGTIHPPTIRLNS